MNRRQFLLAAGASLAAPYVLRFATEAKAQTLRVRRNLLTLAPDDPFFAQYGDAITRMHRLPAQDPRSWRGQALIHPNFCPHGSDERPDFTLWHRHYITYFEKICGNLIGNPGFALPYWDWTANRGRLPQQFDSGPLSVTTWNDPSNYQAGNWGPDRITTAGTRAVTSARGLGDDPRRNGAFTPAMIESILSQSRFDLFQAMLEQQPHNNGHVISGGRNGHMIDGLSSLDPIFWLHHCNVDRLLARWQRAGNDPDPLSFTYSGQFTDETGTPVTVKAADAVNFETMGFTYDDFEGSRVAAVRPLSVPSEAEQSALAGRTVTRDIAVIGRASNDKQSRVNAVTSIPVIASNLVESLAKTRTFHPTALPARKRLGVEGSKILARLTVVPPPSQERDIVVNVFANCPYVSAETEASDPHYCGTFSFFGGHTSHHGNVSIVADLTNALRDQLRNGRIATEKVDVQAVPIPATAGEEAKGALTISAVELILA